MTRKMSTTMLRATVLGALMSCAAVTAACRDGAGSTERAASAAPARATAAAASLDPRSQYDLARALAQAEASRDPGGLAATYQKIRASWTGKRYHWRVRVLEPLCRSREECNVLPFARAGRDKAIVNGWMPHLVLDDTAFASIRRTCAGKPTCEIDMEGTLSQLSLDTEYPTSLEFSQVRVL
ncbi:MAG TPA: hypothetical protein VKB80_15490 [Kofleriaceae bacterium]|nr:hypothetical protein [Kofleriaceae bacterium]